MSSAGSKFRLIDGGLGTELATTYGHANIHGDPLWSSRLITTHPNDIALAHQRYLEAGCDVIETATYQASVVGLQRHLSTADVAVDSSKALDIISQAVQICVHARDEFWQTIENTGRLKPLVAGSIGPYGAHLADRSEFNGHYVDTLSTQELADWHRPQVEAIWRSGVDLLAFETIPSQKEAEAIVLLLREIPDAKAWISFSCQDGKRTCYGESFGDAVTALASSAQVVACGVNCTAPWFIESLLGEIPQLIRETKTIVAYPNSGQLWTIYKDWSDIDMDRVRPLTDYVDQWLDGGASWIGGCCLVTAKDIALLRIAIDEHSSSKNR